MFAHKEISRKVCRPTHSESVPHLLVWVYREHCVHIMYPFCIRPQYLCWSSTASTLLRLPLHHVLISKIFAHACVLLKELQNVAKRKKNKAEFQLGRFLWKAQVKITQQEWSDKKDQQFLQLNMRIWANRYDRFETGLTHPCFRMIVGSKEVQAVSRVSFLFPIFLGRSKETLLAE